MSGVSTYNPSVRVGNWNEDLCLEEDLLKDFIEKKERGELLIDKTHNLYSKILKKVDVSSSSDGYIRFGDTVCVYNPETDTTLSVNMTDSKLHEAECIEGPCGVSASKSLEPSVRNAFVIKSCDESRDGDALVYGQHFLLSTLSGIGGDLNLHSDTATFMKCAKKSRLQEVILQKEIAYHCHWELLHLDPRERLETEGLPVPANEKLLINHCKTNQRLAVLPEFTFRTPFGRDYEVTANTKLNSHKAEEASNHWVIVQNTTAAD
ncbi:cilia- and flagella-associated protein 161-like [Rhopilema esculentum]|uniref:cilia- and flagella-associated protein 161-like n=1 Tax=Rhopilema esculentum TaxID=499914 RepID=UPI0031D120D7